MTRQPTKNIEKAIATLLQNLTGLRSIEITLNLNPRTPIEDQPDACEGCPMRDWDEKLVDDQTDGYFCRSEVCIKDNGTHEESVIRKIRTTAPETLVSEGVTVEEKAAIQEVAPENGKQKSSNGRICLTCMPKGRKSLYEEAGLGACGVCKDGPRTLYQLRG